MERISQATISGVPINLPTHAHGQGYSDINWLIPELVSFVEFDKGPYYAQNGDFSTAGAYSLSYTNTLYNAPISELDFGNYGYGNVLVAGSPEVGVGNLRYGFQIYHDNGSFERPDEYGKFNSVLRWDALPRIPISTSPLWAITAHSNRAIKYRNDSSPPES